MKKIRLFLAAIAVVAISAVSLLVAAPAYADRDIGPLASTCVKNIGQSNQYELHVSLDVYWHSGSDVRTLSVITWYYQESNQTYYDVGAVEWWVKAVGGSYVELRYDPPGSDPWGQTLIGQYKPAENPGTGHYFFIRVFPGYAYEGAPYCDSPVILN